MKKSLFFLIAGAILSTQAATYYVSPLGNNNNPGTDPEKPLKSLQVALKKAVSGDTVLLKGGLYREQISREWREKNPKPITIKAMPDETPVITFGWRIRGWKKRADGLFTAPCPYAVRDLWQRNTLDRYLKMSSVELVKNQPGAYHQDPRDGTLTVNPLITSRYNDPEQAGFTVIPYCADSRRRPAPHTHKNPTFFHDGMNLIGQNLHIDGLHFAFHGRGGFYIRGRYKDSYYGSGSIRNSTAVGTTAGFRVAWVIDGFVMENCRALRNSGGGIQVGSYQKNVKIINNFTLDNGGSIPFFDNFTTAEGNLYNLSRYGGPYSEYVDFIGNTVLSLDHTRRGGVMRCKGGIRKHTNVCNNVLGGDSAGGVTFYAVPGSTATVSNNTVFPWKLSFTVSNTGKKYKPDLKSNLHGQKEWQKKIRFVNAEKYDFRLLPDSPYKGLGAFPGTAPVWFLAPDGKGAGRLPETPANAAKLAALLKSGDTVYFMPGTFSGSYTFRNLKNITLSDRSCGKALWQKATFKFENCSNVRIDSMDFKNCRFEFINTTANFTENIFTGVDFTAVKGKTVFANNRLFNARFSGNARAVFRENLFDNCRVTCKDILSENNGFADAAQLKAWGVKETFPSFVAGVKRNGKTFFPVENLVEGTAGTWVGGRPVKYVPGPLKVENFKVTTFDCGTRAAISWTTPEEYVRAEAYASQNGKKTGNGKRPFGRFLTTDNSLGLKNLTPGVPCKVYLYLYRHNETKPWKKIFEFTPVKNTRPNTPRILETGKNKPFKTIAAALANARPGDTVLIAPGTYGESLTVWQDDITIKAAKAGTVKVSGEFLFDHIIRGEDIKGLTVENLDFVGLRYSSVVTAVTFQRAERIKFKNCRFLSIGLGKTGNNHFFGSELKDVEISNCVFDRAFQCLWITDSKGYVKVDHNTFWGSGINAMHLGGGPGAELTITNNLIQDVVGGHISPAVSVGDPKSKVYCDWNLYWNTKRCPKQHIYGEAGVLGTIALQFVLRKDACLTIEEARKRYNVEKNGIFADPKLKNPQMYDFTLAPDSPAKGRASDGKDIGADMSVFQ